MNAIRAVAALCISAVLGVSGAAAASRAPLGLPPLPQTDSVELVALGKTLFFDKRLSADQTVSCASCHVPTIAFANNLKEPTGVGQRHGFRNTPSLLNVAYERSLFWDGRAATLEQQAPLPLSSSTEHGLSEVALLRFLNSDAAYPKLFASAFGEARISTEQVARALAAFERTLLAGDSPFDRYVYGKDRSALSASAVRGMELFRGRAKCASCHLMGENDALFTDHQFHSSPSRLSKKVLADLESLTAQRELSGLVSSRREVAELGRFVATGKPKDIGAFKTPSLRNVARTRPYMHDGSVATLEEAVEKELYQRDGAVAEPIILTSGDKRDLIAFLESLSSSASH